MATYRVEIIGRRYGSLGVRDQRRTYTIESDGNRWDVADAAIQQAHRDEIEHVGITEMTELKV